MMIHQAIILAAGENSRFAPFSSKVSHKSAFQLMGVSIILRTIQSLLKIGIHEIIIIKSSENITLSQLIDSQNLPINITYIDQPTALGMANALLLAKTHIHAPFLLINPQQINIDEHLKSISDLNNSSQEAVLFSQTTTQPQKYGILQLDGDKVVGLKEKPSSLDGLSDQRLLGIYILNQKFVEFLSTTSISETQLEEALDQFAQTHYIRCISSKTPSLSLKYAWDIFAIISYLFSTSSSQPQVHPNATIHPTALLSGQVIIEDGAKVFPYAILEGPCYIGKHAVVGSYCKVRQESVLEDEVEIQNNVEVKHSYIGSRTHIHSGYIGDSIIGDDVRIGAGFISANRRLDRKNIHVKILDKLVDTELQSFGCLIGNESHIGIHCGTNPGSTIVTGSVVYPGTIIG